MENLLSYIPIPDMVVLLTACSILGTVYAYLQKWAWSKDRDSAKAVGLRTYLFGDGRAVARSFTKLIGALAVTVTVDMTAGMDVTSVIVLGFGIGLAIPEKVEQQEKENNGINAQLDEKDGTSRQDNSGPSS